MPSPCMTTSLTPEVLAAALPQIPPVAQVLADLQRLLGDTETALEDIARLIRIDPALASRVIAISNSAHFHRGEACDTIFDAVNRIGFREVYHVVAIVGSAAIVSHPVLAYRRDADMMWKESLACALAAEALAEACGEDPVSCYLAGLLHGVGRVAVNQHLAAQARESGGPMRQLTDDGFPRDFSGDEFLLLTFTQADVAAEMLTRWNFVPSVVEPVRAQYEPLKAEEPHDRVAAVLYGARLLRSAVCDHQEPVPSAGDDEAFDLIGLTREDVLAHAPTISAALAKALSLA